MHETTTATAPACWVLTDGAAGNERQALALAHALGLTPRSLALRLPSLHAWLAPRLLPTAQHALPDELRTLWAAPWPPVAIGCGRTGAYFTRLLRRASGGTTRCVQILDPRIDPRHWDLVVAPSHDRVRGTNVLSPLGSLHPVDDDWLDTARTEWPELGALPTPRIVVLLGGPRRGAPLDSDRFTTLLTAAHAHRGEGSLLLIASRRTPAAIRAMLPAALGDAPGMYWRDADDGANPYAGALAWADRILVSADSVNMLSEACAVGRPVHAAAAGTDAGRLARFHGALRERGLLHALDAQTPTHQVTLRETAAIAAEVRQRLALPDDGCPE